MLLRADEVTDYHGFLLEFQLQDQRTNKYYPYETNWHDAKLFMKVYQNFVRDACDIFSDNKKSDFSIKQFSQLFTQAFEKNKKG